MLSSGLNDRILFLPYARQTATGRVQSEMRKRGVMLGSAEGRARPHTSGMIHDPWRQKTHGRRAAGECGSFRADRCIQTQAPLQLDSLRTAPEGYCELPQAAREVIGQLQRRIAGECRVQSVDSSLGDDEGQMMCLCVGSRPEVLVAEGDSCGRRNRVWTLGRGREKCAESSSSYRSSHHRPQRAERRTEKGFLRHAQPLLTAAPPPHHSTHSTSSSHTKRHDGARRMRES